MKSVLKILIFMAVFSIMIPLATCTTQEISSSNSTDMSGAINTAINNCNPGDSVVLNPGVYFINSPIIMRSGISLVGNGATIKAATDSTGGIAGSKDEDGYVRCINIQNVEISGITFLSTASEIRDGGAGEGRNCILLTDCTNISIHDCIAQKYLYNDFVECDSSNNVQIYNNVGQSGHDFIEFIDCENCRAYNNDITVQTNTGIRDDGSADIELDHNTFTGVLGTGWCLIEVENEVQNLDIHHNIFHDYRGSKGNDVTQPVHASGSVSVHDNVIWNVGEICIGTAQNNIINMPDHNITNYVNEGYGCNMSTTYTSETNNSENGCTDSCKVKHKPNKCDDLNSNSTIETTPIESITYLLGISLKQSQTDYDLSGEMLNSSSNDLALAATLTNNTANENEFKSKLIAESILKDQFYKDLSNLSMDNHDFARKLLNNSRNN